MSRVVFGLFVKRMYRLDPGVSIGFCGLHCVMRHKHIIHTMPAPFNIVVLAIGLFTTSLSWGTPTSKTLEALGRQKTSLEAQLAKVNERIAELEAATSNRPASDSTPTYYVKEFGISEVNSAGGVEPYATFVNPNPKLVIKYIRLRVTPYNAVGDVISSRIGEQSTAGMYMTGPLTQADGEKKTGWEPIWYNHSATCLKIQSVQVEFVNGRTQTFAGRTLRAALSPELKNDCRAKAQ